MMFDSNVQNVKCLMKEMWDSGPKVEVCPGYGGLPILGNNIGDSLYWGLPILGAPILGLYDHEKSLYWAIIEALLYPPKWV